MSRARNPFSRGTVALVLLIGAAAFLLLLYALGQGWTGEQDRNGGEHAASNGLTGFAGLVEVLERTGHEVTLSRSAGSFDEYGLLILTPPGYADGEEVGQIIKDRRYLGPTMLVLPKWYAMPVPADAKIEQDVEDGWVLLMGAANPQWFGGLDLAKGGKLGGGKANNWKGYGLSGSLPEPDTVQALVEQPDLALDPLVLDNDGDMLAGISYYDDEAWPVVVVFEPDLMNNFGMGDKARGQLAYQLVHTAFDGEDLPIIFDLTLSGLGSSENLLTLAFAPPFLAATLCLILAGLVIAWRGFRRFGPPVAQAPGMAHGKRQLALNGAALLGRVRRWHLLSEPYAALVSKRIARALGIREQDPAARVAAIDRALQREGGEVAGFASAAHAMRQARSPREIIRAARALRTIERTLTR